MIELAPHHKMGLALRSPLILAVGMIGYGDAVPRALDLGCCGAWVTGPIGLRSRGGVPPPRLAEVRGGVPPPRLAEVRGGVVLAETGQNPGVDQVIRRHSAAWERWEVPVIARLWGAPEEQAAVAQRLEGAGGVAALELAPDDRLGPEAAADLVEAVRGACEIPLLAVLPLASNVVDWAVACVEAGADALVVGRAPRALGIARDAQPVRGRLYGPAVAALSMAALEAVALADLGVPLVGSGGVHHVSDVHAFLRLGAMAVQIDTAVWVDPTLLERIGKALEDIG